MNQALSRKYSFFGIVLSWYALLYWRSLTFRYVEGDDARSFCFHAMGRNPKLMPPYTPYHGMMDLFLRSFPPKEHLILQIGMGITSICTVIMLGLVCLLVFDYLNISSGKQRSISTLLILFAVPEFSYFGLVYNPSVVGMMFVVGAHLLLRRTLLDDRDRTFAWEPCLSAVLFGIGTACRWDIAMYGFVIATDVLLIHPTTIQRFKRVVLWGLGAIAASIMGIALSGYWVKDVIVVMEMIKQSRASQRFDLTSFSALQTLATPATILFCFVGLLLIIKCSRRLLAILIVSLLAVSPALYTGTPKYILPCIPIILVCLIQGFWGTISKFAQSRHYYGYLLLALLVAAPWFIGLSVYSSNTQWGPGFEIRKEGSANTAISRALGNAEKRKIGINNFRFCNNSGMALPTREGPRPLWGNAYVLFGGRWRELITQLDLERKQLVISAIKTKLPLIELGNEFMTAHLLEQGFVPTRVLVPRTTELKCWRQHFINSRGQCVDLISLCELPFPLIFQYLIPLKPTINTALVYFNSSSCLESYCIDAPLKVKREGPFSALLNL